MFDKNLFAERLKALRKEKQLKQEEIGTLLSVTKTQISDMENARRTTTIENLVLLAEFFCVSTDYLLGLTDSPERH